MFWSGDVVKRRVRSRMETGFWAPSAGFSNRTP